MHGQAPSANREEVGPSDIAIVGMSGRFPGCRSIDDLWARLRDGLPCITTFSDDELIAAGTPRSDLKQNSFVRAGGVIPEMDRFDAAFFGLSPKDAAIMDPQHRIFLECCWEAFENAAIVPRRFDGAIGVFAGCGPNNYFMRNVMGNPDLVRSTGYFLLRHTGNDRDFLPTGVSYRLDLRGPSVAVQTACSTSLVAVHMACQALLNGECDMALAGGVTADWGHAQGYFYHENEIQAPDGVCRPFDHRSAGTVLTSGAGVVLLRRLEDALNDGDIVHAVIKGSAINNDGARKVGYLAPSVDGHADAVVEALGVAGLTADDISYVETHGTGTAVGDPIEIAALSSAFGRSSKRRQYCPIGSIKASIGHTDTAAGIAGLIKVVEALRHEVIPPTLNYEAPNPNIDFAASPFFVADKLRPWPAAGVRRYAGVSSLGVGGTNAHVIVQDAPVRGASKASRGLAALALSAKSKAALAAMGPRLARHLEAHPELTLADVAHTLHEGREVFEHRRVVVARDMKTAVAELANGGGITGRASASSPGIVFMFPGGGAQYAGMGRRLYASEPAYKAAVDECLALLAPHVDFDLRSMLLPSPGAEAEADSRLARPCAAICGIFVTSYATAMLWRSKGIEPSAMTGHSLGEYVAACLAGVFSLADALRIVARRGRIMEQAGASAMLSVGLAPTELRGELGDALEISAVNAPELCLVSGPEGDIDRLAARLGARDVVCRKLHFGAASHCRSIEPYLAEFRAAFDGVALQPPKLRFISNVTGDWANPAEVATPEYWMRHFRQPVQFDAGLRTLITADAGALVEVGPGTTLCTLARQQRKKPPAIIPSLRHPGDDIDDAQQFLQAIGGLWCAGIDVELPRPEGAEAAQRVVLPTYPFQRQRFWIDAAADSRSSSSVDDTRIEKSANMDDWLFEPRWIEAPPPVFMAAESGPERYLVFEDTIGVAAAISQQLRAKGHDVVTVRESDSFYKFGDNLFAVAPEADAQGYNAVVEDLAKRGKLPSRIIHAWSITDGVVFRPGSNFYHHTSERGFYSLIHIARALAGAKDIEALHIDVLSNGMQAVGGEMVRFPEKATLLGPVRVIPHEVPGFTARSIDIQIDGSGSADDRERRIQDVAREVSGDVLAKPSDEIIAYRDGGRFVETLMPAGLQRAESPLRRGGTYLITGGLGGLGLVIARHLAESYAANLVLVSRQCLPSRESWEAFAAKVGRRDRTGQAIAELREIEALGGRVLHVAADVANIEQMRDGLSAARARFGTFDGVIHAAGVLDDGPLLSKSVESMEAVIAPKVHGATLLAELLADDPLQFFVAFSSTSAFLGPAGQVDYAAANAFLNAFAKSQRGRDVRFSAIDWGVWKDIGAGKAAAERLLGLSAPRHDILVAARHPMLSGVTSRTDRSFTVVGSVSPAQHWVLDEHRLESGQAVLPGTGYVELIAAAFREATGATKVAFNELSFLQPMFVSDEGATILQIVFSQSADGFDFEVSSQSDGATATVLNAIGSIDACDADETRRAMPAIEQPPDDGAAERPYRKQRFLKLGERWSGIERIVFGKSTAWADITLPTRFIDDLTAYQAHPAALDLATGFALELVAGYVPETDSFVPMAYGGLRLLAPLQRRVRSRVKLLSGSVESGLARFAVEITDLNGNRLVEIDRFDMRYLKDASGFGRADAPGEKRSARPALSRSEQSFVDMVACGITAKEGMTVLEQFLGARRPGPVVATSIKVPTLLALSRIAIEDMRSDKVAFERPTLDSEYEAPRDAIEKTLAQIWQNLLGVAEVGINDDFFELGGHSLIAVRLFARIKQEWGIEHPISSLFGAPTIARLADILRADIGDAAIRRDARGALPHGDSRIIVPMTKIDRDLPALFIVAGMFGNVLNLRHLASHLSDEYAVYGVQARGLLGEDRPHTRFEDMARDYIEEIQKIQPTGPYLLGGFSGGGIIAYEIAQQLRARGDTVASLVMLDTITPQVPSATTADKLRIELMRWRAEGLAYPIERLRQRRAWFKAQANKSDGALMPAEFRSREIEAGFRAACASYQVQPYYGRVDLFCPPKPIRYRLRNGRILNQYREYLDQTNHWSRYIRGQIIVHDVPGDHDSLVLEPHVRVLKKAISAVLKAALEGVCDVNEDVRSAGPGRREANTRALPPKEQSLRPQF